MPTNELHRFNEADHSYHMMVNGVESTVPSVTTVMGEILGQPYFASEWHMQRGRAVHACAAMIALNQPFENDPQIDGQVEACRRFFRDTSPQILEVEKAYYSSRYMFAGTLDLCCMVPSQGDSLLIDYKATLTKQTEVQLGGYSILTGVRRGLGVQLNADGTYKTSEIYDLRRPAQEFLSLLSAYNTKARLGMLNKKEDGRDGV
jgi:hypothetical protein